MLAFIQSILKNKSVCESLLCYSACFIRNSPKLKVFFTCFVLFVGSSRTHLYALWC